MDNEFEKDKVIIRPITYEDKDILFEWANDELCRRNSFNTNMISYDEHCQWFEKKMKTDDCKMYIIEVDEKSVGQIRLEKRDGNEIEIGYFIESQYRGRGYGKKLLEFAEGLLRVKNRNEINLVGKVKYDNVYSRNCFVKLEYEEKCGDEYVIYTKRIRDDSNEKNINKD